MRSDEWFKQEEERAWREIEEIFALLPERARFILGEPRKLDIYTEAGGGRNFRVYMAMPYYYYVSGSAFLEHDDPRLAERKETSPYIYIPLLMIESSKGTIFIEMEDKEEQVLQAYQEILALGLTELFLGVKLFYVPTYNEEERAFKRKCFIAVLGGDKRAVP